MVIWIIAGGIFFLAVGFLLGFELVGRITRSYIKALEKHNKSLEKLRECFKAEVEADERLINSLEKINSKQKERIEFLEDPHYHLKM